jgi:uncharacterized protein YbjT (DUF2867 family)
LRPSDRRAIRNPTSAVLPDAVELVAGDVLEPASLAAAVSGRDAVRCTLGTPSPRRQSTLLEHARRILSLLWTKRACGG